MKANASGLEHEEEKQACQNTSGEVEVGHTEIHAAFNIKGQLQGNSPPLSFPSLCSPYLDCLTILLE